MNEKLFECKTVEDIRKSFNVEAKKSKVAFSSKAFEKAYSNYKQSSGDDIDSQYDEPISKWNGDSFKNFIADTVLELGSDVGEEMIKIMKFPKGTDLYKWFSENPSGYNNDENHSKYRNFGGAMYDIWEEVSSKLKKIKVSKVPQLIVSKSSYPQAKQLINLNGNFTNLLFYNVVDEIPSKEWDRIYKKLFAKAIEE